MKIKNEQKIRVGIIGTGKVGTDLLVKVLRSPLLDCKVFAGRNLKSEGITIANSLGVTTSCDSIQAIVDRSSDLDLVFDATSANDHKVHAPMLKQLGLLAIDLTPANVGYACVPALNIDGVRKEENINMVTCGGQASVPIAEVLSRCLSNITRIEVKSTLAADSIGPATIANIDNYYHVTTETLRKFTGVDDVKVDLVSDNSSVQPVMLTTIRAYSDNAPSFRLMKELESRVAAVQSYVPGYSIEGRPHYEKGYIDLAIRVRGQGDYLPEYAGNLDIINCAAIASAENIAMRRTRRALPHMISAMTQLWSKAS